MNRDGQPILEKVISESGEVVYVTVKTGEIKWRDPDEYKAREIG